MYKKLVREMDNSINGFAEDDNKVNEGSKPPPEECPRCNSDNTKFCYYNNYNMSQPRYFCKYCRRHWTHGGALRNIPIGGSGRKSKRPKLDHQSLVSVENKLVDHQPSRHVQENNQFVGSFGGSSSSSVDVVIGNPFGSLSDIPFGVINVTPLQSFRPMDRLDFRDESFQQDYLNVGSNDLIGNPLINQSIGGYVDNHNSYRITQPEWNQSFVSNSNTMNMNHMANACGSRGTLGTEMSMNNNNNFRNSCLFRSTRYLEKHGP